jgi:hypothetical protein
MFIVLNLAKGLKEDEKDMQKLIKPRNTLSGSNQQLL